MGAGQSEPESESREKQVEAAKQAPRKDGNKWWKPWGKDEAQPEESIQEAEPVKEQSEAKARKWWKPWN